MSHAPSTRTRVKRMHLRGHYDEATVHAILDVMPICSVGYVFDGAPFVTSTLQWREGNHIYWHGSSASRMLEACEDAEVCVNVSIIDAFVMARSAFNHSCNYRSVMAFGRAYKVTDPKEKLARLKTFTNQLFPGRWDHLRPVTDKELKSTTVLGLALDEASAKIRTGMPAMIRAMKRCRSGAGCCRFACKRLHRCQTLMCLMAWPCRPSCRPSKSGSHSPVST